MIKLNNLDKWQFLGDGEVMHFAKDEPRTVRVDFNAPQGAMLTLKEVGVEDSAGFDVRLSGRDVLEFSVNGKFDVYTDNGLWFYTADSSDWSVENVDHASLTRVVERRVRNVEMEHMMYLAQLNIERRMAAQFKELEQQYERDTRKREAAAAKRAESERAAKPSASGGAKASGKAREVVGNVPSLATADASDDGGGDSKPKSK